MSGIDLEQEKQPISSINGQPGDSDLHPPAKDVADEQTKGTADTVTVPTSCQSESVETQQTKETTKGEGDEDKTKESQSAEMTVNGVEQSVDNQEKTEPSANVGETSVEETKPGETPEGVSDDKQVNGEGIEVGAGKESESAGESKESEPSHEPVAIETNREQGESSAESKETEPSHEPAASETKGGQGESSS